MTDGPHRRRVLGLVGSVAMVAMGADDHDKSQSRHSFMLLHQRTSVGVPCRTRAYLTFSSFS
jgi:hypothetical protein